MTHLTIRPGPFKAAIFKLAVGENVRLAKIGWCNGQDGLPTMDPMITEGLIPGYSFCVARDWIADDAPKGLRGEVDKSPFIVSSACLKT